MALDTGLVEEAQGIFRDLNLTQTQAQKLVDFQIGVQQKAAEAQEAEFQETHDKWLSDARADKEIGGDKWNASISEAKKAIQAFGDDALKDLLRDTGAGSHPAVIRMFSKIGKLVKEDVDPGGKPKTQEFSLGSFLLGKKGN